MWEKIKKIIEREGGKGIIIEDGQPVYLVKRLDETEEDMEKINRDIENLKASENKDDKIIEPEDDASKEVRIEDLPF
ncbi:MAG: hypothetical protein CO003_00895 [Candidatus Portnoybacteria bacterium CG_4_8_14_3_um_filter_44_15]|uniref:Uncharacterized protein n=4 Tax=Candidatus Portnoyibacteriota TaxID=1817913 RepID=A0A2M7YLJ3_9BACT|nr:MAG: hypothetical protein AUJ11_00965 [Parcubacteria group bacterium CG1_02_44_65]PIP15872.1 MAG: hypothetical protein COX45_00810 [Candidatus Portnoybacteria bacterium CG23_combo_of_CG06-09_8_20_14_all_44_36]PIW74778.1 MAG: hypothetical protein CO003_00895 [Candidatus Portnoybacteria bacterium CG_4_8_14_3_um_filter_44_15]PIZ69213.1 MAG: hypothetical protein COY10_01810 [Candidatus Portnoybacteria bacterium CG_4_10_14_0_2_um_filter_43_36]PJA63841.1 MAG: hypothetical protein CO160_01735 [Cand